VLVRRRGWEKDNSEFGAKLSAARQRLRRAAVKQSLATIDETRDQLAPREYQVAMLVARGLSNKEVAHQLGLSHGTVKFHMHQIIRKLGVKSRFELMTMVLREAAARREPGAPR
jgi:DNA-binding NarL/FixJ family response regulator